ARLSPLLGRGASRRPDARRPRPGGADRAARVGDLDDADRQRRRDAAALLAVQSGGGVLRACGAVSRGGRPRAPRRRRGRAPGSGRAGGTERMTTHVLQRDRTRALPDDFPQQLAELLAYLEDRFPPDNPLARFGRILPKQPKLPEPWLLGSSAQSALWAAEL